MPDQVDRDVVATGDMAVEEQTVQGRRAREFNPSLLRQLAPQRIVECFTDFDATAWQMPAGDIAVPDQKHPRVAVQHHGADPKTHATGGGPIQMKKQPQHRLKAVSKALL